MTKCDLRCLVVWRFPNPIWRLDWGSVPAITALPILVGLTGANARKALWHVLKEPGHDIRPCRGNIPRQKMRQYKELENSKALAKDLRTQKTASMMNNIQDLQDRTVLKMSSGRASALVHCALSPVSF